MSRKVVNSLSQYQKDNEIFKFNRFEPKKQELLDLFKHTELLIRKSQ